MRVIEAPNDIILNDNEITCFLAGGITDCEDWQSKVIEYLEETIRLDDLVLLNPRRKTFDVTDKSASRKQIEWEFNALNNMDIFTMYFADSTSVQPICMYELGRHLERMQHRFMHILRHGEIMIVNRNKVYCIVDKSIVAQIPLYITARTQKQINPKIRKLRSVKKWKLPLLPSS